MQPKQYTLFSLPVIVGALGFFVDVYDLLLFGIIRKPSLADLGLSPSEVFAQGEFILSIQMTGLLIGGIIWGIMGDKKGRLSVLFGSILLYSLANIANGFVHDTTQYSIMRFIAGIGLAGELGAGITLVSELLPKEKRGIAASIIAGFGIFGAVTAFFVSREFNWRVCFYIGGGMGLVLLILRVNIFESKLFGEIKKTNVQRGNFLMLFNNRDRFIRYLRCILIGIPAWYVIGVLVTFSDKFGEAFGIKNIDPAKSIMFQYLAIAFGDLTVGLLSNYLKSRKKALYIFYGITSLFIILYFLQQNGTPFTMYLACAGLGFGTGFSVVYITMSAEQFGTNLRATAAVSVPNMVRGALPLIILLFKGLRNLTGNYITGGWITGLILMGIAIIAAYKTKETFGKDLNYVEE
ncbi:MAG: MFS transporter [Bacteroidetes bacterium]|nr:MFS transporter [Bacteroidota bacterium]